MTTEVRPATTRVGDTIERWAEEKPDAVAVITRGRTWTWVEWRDDIRRVSGALLAAGVGRGDHVAYLGKNDPACIQVTLGAAAIGAANAVINWRLAGDELDYVINDSEARLLFVDAELVDQVARLRAKMPTVAAMVTVGDDAGWDRWLDGATPTPPDERVGADDVCVVMYSSGTTGRPKGVMLTHGGLLAHTQAVPATFPFDEGSANLVAMPLFHVGGTAYVLFGFDAGVPTIMTREPDGASLLWALEQGATHAFLVPAVIGGLLDAGDDVIRAFSALRFLGYGASPMPRPSVERALAAWPGTQLFQVYGMTELCGVVTTLGPEDHRDPEHPERLDSAGTVVDGTELRVVDPESLQDVEPGTPGELWFRSPQVMKGYLNLPEATAEVLTDDGWLRSGDVGRVDDAGYVFIEDRVKDMIITGGENVYSPEVERVVLDHPAVAEVAVIGVPDERWGESVKAVVVLETGDQVDADELLGFCQERLARFKCPRSIDVVDELPRSPTGKVLKKVLREPHWSGRGRQV